jgi:hypothetical protein
MAKHFRQELLEHYNSSPFFRSIRMEACCASNDKLVVLVPEMTKVQYLILHNRLMHFLLLVANCEKMQCMLALLLKIYLLK